MSVLWLAAGFGLLARPVQARTLRSGSFLVAHRAAARRLTRKVETTIALVSSFQLETHQTLPLITHIYVLDQGPSREARAPDSRSAARRYPRWVLWRAGISSNRLDRRRQTVDQDHPKRPRKGARQARIDPSRRRCEECSPSLPAQRHPKRS